MARKTGIGGPVLRIVADSFQPCPYVRLIAHEYGKPCRIVPLCKRNGENVVTNQNAAQPRWATRKEAMQYARVGSTKFSELVRDRRIVAKRLDAKKLIIDLNSIDALYECLPDGSARP